MKVGRKAVLGVGALVGLLTLGTTAHALTSLSIDKCLSSKIKTEGKGEAAYSGCYAKGASKGTTTDPTCLTKAQGKIVPAFAKTDAKLTCQVEGDGPNRDSDTSAYAASVDSDVGHAAGKCDAAKQKCVSKYVAGVTGCYSKAAGKTGTIDPTCVGKVAAKLADGVKGCLDKAAAAGDCTNAGSQAAALKSAADAYIDAQACDLDPANPQCGGGATPTPMATPTATSTPACGNGTNDPGEACDESAPSSGWLQCGSDFTCVNCNCGCPTKVVFSGDATAPESLLDSGWTGISHRAPIISNGDVTVGLSCSASQRPCGVCAVSGPVANPQAGAGQLDDQRCTNDPSRHCVVGNDTPCTPRKCLGGANQGASCTNDSQCPGGSCPASGTCQFFFGSNLALAAGGVSTCVSNVFNGSVTGTANVETGDAVNTAFLTSSVFLAASVDQPCSRCVGDATINDGVLGGTCDTGPRQGLPCDGNGTVPGRPDFGTTSLDCPSPSSSKIATLGINLSNTTATRTQTLTANSPNCNGAAGNKCLCGTCNNGNNQVCFSNADCPDPAGPIGPICNGKRCLGGANVGAACNNASECPSSSCATPGEPTKPASCQDDTTTVNILDCADAADGTIGDQEGGCTQGPVDTNCTIASGHGQRGCSSDADCGGSPGSCGTVNRKCFLTGGGTFQPPASGLLKGTDTLIAVGMADVPMHDTANPTLASVFCVAPTGASSVNNVAGLPGPSRITIKGTAVAHP